jgi:hypothetical protein
VSEILGPGRRLADIANLSDDARKERPATAPWHYVNIPFDAEGFYRPRDCPEDQCVIGAIERFRDELRKPGLLPEARFEALFHLVHFIGDLHQPLHCLARDHGGNDLQVVFLGRPNNLHRVWDTELIRYLDPSPERLLEKLSAIPATSERVWTGGTPESWALESHRLARGVAYRLGRKTHQGVVLDRSYARRATPVVTQQLQKAGIRIAVVLNNVFR